VNKQLKLGLEISGADTIGGYVTKLRGDIPEEGDVIPDDPNRLSFEVVKMAGKRVNLVKIRKLVRPVKKKRKKEANLFILFCLLILGSMAGMAQTDALEGISGSSSGTGLAYVFSVLLILSLALKAFYAGAETAVVSVSKARIDVLVQQGNARAERIKKLWQEPDKMLGTVLVSDNLMSAAAGMAGLQLIVYALPGKEGIQELLNTVIMTLLLMVICEILPKTAFRAKADTLALKSSRGLWIADRILRPVVWLLTKITNYAVNMADKQNTKEKLRVMREELKLLARMGEKEGIFQKEQLHMITSVLDLEMMTLEKVMTPLVDVVALPKNASPKDFYGKVSETGYSRIPIYEERVDNLIGIVNVLDVLYAQPPPPTIAGFIQKDVYHEPESKRVYTLLRDLKRRRKAMVFVVDEYGGVVGIVTMEDLVEEILGEIRDEKDIEDVEGVHQIDSRTITCSGKTEIVAINNAYGISIPSGDYNTIAGYIMSLLERIPRAGETIETKELKIVILDADLKSIRRVRIQSKNRDAP
jgi:putative hemolysin